MPTVPVIQGRLNFVAGVEGEVEEAGVEVARVGDFVAVEGQEEVGFDEGLDGVFAGLDEVVAAAARKELGEHFLVGSVVFDRDVDAGLLLEGVDDRARDIFRPAEEVERLGGGGGNEQDGPEEEREGEAWE